VNLTRPHFRAGTVALAAACVVAGCSSVESFLAGDKIDYRSASSKTTPLEVPPDLTQLSRDSRYQPQASTVSASSFQSSSAVAASPSASQPAVAPTTVGDAHIERDGSQRWLATSMTPEQLWPQLKSFWQSNGFLIKLDQPEAGVMETDWAENRAKLPQDFLRRSVGQVFDSLYSTGERDKFRTRVERTANGSEIYISHRGMEEIVTGQAKDTTIWQPRPTDPQLEAEFLARLMARLGTKDTAVAAAQPASAASGASAGTGPDAASVAAVAAPAPRARVVSGQTAALQVDESFDRAWRRVGLALDRSGFTVEDRDRKGGLYFVRYVDPKLAGQEEPNFFQKLFTFGDKKSASDATLSRYRIALKSEGDKTVVSVLNSQGAPEGSDIGQQIVNVLLSELK
jgi:outer membrane protein assembly factor BamC